MYPNSQENATTDFHEFLHNKQQAFQRAFELVRRNLNEKQRRRNAIYNKRSTAQQTKKDKKFCSIIQPSLLEQLLKLKALGKDRM